MKKAIGFLAVVGVVAAAAYIFFGSETGDGLPAPNEVANAPTVIPFDVYRGDIRLRGEINGREVNLLVDNGMLWDELLFFGSAEVEELGINFENDAEISGLGEGGSEGVPGRHAVGIDLRVGDLHMPNQEGYVTPYVEGALNLWAGTHGQVSAHLFNSYVALIDFDALTITLFDPDTFVPPEGFVELPLTKHESEMWSIPARIGSPDGTIRDLELAIDLGDSNPLEITFDDVSGVPLPENVIPASMGFGIQGETLGFFGPAASLELGGFVLEPVMSGYVPEKQFEEVMLGFEILSRFNIAFDYSNGRLYLMPNRYFDEPYRVELSGMMLQQAASGRAEIAGVYTRTSAANAGLRAGDTISSVNGNDVSAFEFWDVLHLLGTLQTATITVLRDGEEHTAEIEIRRATFHIDDSRYQALQPNSE